MEAVFYFIICKRDKIKMIGYWHKFVFYLKKKKTAEKEILLMGAHDIVDSSFLYPIPLQWQYLAIHSIYLYNIMNLYIV